jgi:hypothetical protein
MESSLCVDKHTPYGADKGRFLERGKKLPILAGAGSCAAPAGGHELRSEFGVRGPKICHSSFRP